MLREVDLDVRDVAYLICSQDSEYALLFDWIDWTALKMRQIEARVVT